MGASRGLDELLDGGLTIDLSTLDLLLEGLDDPTDLRSRWDVESGGELATETAGEGHLVLLLSSQPLDALGEVVQGRRDPSLARAPAQCHPKSLIWTLSWACAVAVRKRQAVMTEFIWSGFVLGQGGWDDSRYQ